MGSYRLRQPATTAYKYTGTSMDGAVAGLLGAENCVAASGARPALLLNVTTHNWMELRPTNWVIVRSSGIEVMGNQQFVMTYRDVAGDPIVAAPVDPGPDA